MLLRVRDRCCEHSALNTEWNSFRYYPLWAGLWYWLRILKKELKITSVFEQGSCVVVNCCVSDILWPFLKVSCFSRGLHRRASAGGLDGPFQLPPGADLNNLQHPAHHPGHPHGHRQRPHSSMSGKMGVRSWHATPFTSDDEEGEHHFFKEEKKNRIKMEIARRRHQIEENARLHEELIRLAKLRENAEGGGHQHPHQGGPHRLGVGGYEGHHPALSPGNNNVLRSVDEILRAEHGGPGHAHPPRHPGVARREHGSFNPDRYTASVYDRVADFSPINSDFSNEIMYGHDGGLRHASRGHNFR